MGVNYESRHVEISQRPQPERAALPSAVPQLRLVRPETVRHRQKPSQSAALISRIVPRGANGVKLLPLDAEGTGSFMQRFRLFVIFL